MCLLCVIEPNVTPSREHLLNATKNNPDGFGYAFHCGDKIITGRGMNAEEVIDRFLTIRSGLPNTWAMFHARYTTHGATTKANCHPFRVGGDPSTVIGHNGIIPITVEVGDTRSDTRVFADEWMPEILEDLDDEQTFAELEDFIGGSKVAVFTHDPRLKKQVYILNEDMGSWDKGIWWSNSTYKYHYEYSSYSTRAYGSLSGLKWWDYEYSEDFLHDRLVAKEEQLEYLVGAGVDDDGSPYCTKCLALLDELDLDEGLCGVCNYCLECTQFWTGCLCYRPAKVERVGHGRLMQLPLSWDDEIAY